MKGRYMLYTCVMNSRLRRVQTVLMLLTHEHHQDDVESKSVDRLARCKFRLRNQFRFCNLLYIQHDQVEDHDTHYAQDGLPSDFTPVVTN